MHNQSMKSRLVALPVLVTAATMWLSAGAQVPNPTTIAPGVRSLDVITNDPNGFSIYQIRPVQRSLTAVNFFINDGPSGIAFHGTDLARQVSGKAKVQARGGRTNIAVKIEHLPVAGGFGPEYLTYVLWAISADGRAQNLGEFHVEGGKGQLKVSTSFQSFGLIVTAEPYYAVSQPSDVVVAESAPTKHTDGILQEVNTHYSLLPRGLYANTSGAQTVPNPTRHAGQNTLALDEAENAQRVALSAGAQRYSPDIIAEVAQDLQNAKTPPNGKHDDGKLALSFARQATQRAEDARISALHKEASERESDAARSVSEAQAQVMAARAAQMRAEAERDQAMLAAGSAQAAADRARQNAAANSQDAAALRARLRAQLNAVLATTETARGLIVDLNGVLFDTGKSTLKAQAKLSLTKVATILSLYPTLKVAAEGYTDSTGSQELNQRLSNERARAVADFLIANGVASANVTAEGYGESSPVATNATAAGRTKNRRVDLVVSGAVIGVETSKRPANRQ